MLFYDQVGGEQRGQAVPVVGQVAPPVLHAVGGQGGVAVLDVPVVERVEGRIDLPDLVQGGPEGSALIVHLARREEPPAPPGRTRSCAASSCSTMANLGARDPTSLPAFCSAGVVEVEPHGRQQSVVAVLLGWPDRKSYTRSLPDGGSTGTRPRPACQCLVTTVDEVAVHRSVQSVGDDGLLASGARASYRLGVGAVVGEMALLQHGFRSVTVTAVTPMTVLAMSARDFNSIVGSAPRVTERLLVTLAERLRQTDAAMIAE